MPFSPRPALLTLSTLLLPACVPSVIVGDQPQDSATAPGTSESPPDTATPTTVTPTTAAPGTTTSETDPTSSTDMPVSATADTTSTATSATSDTAGTTGTTGTTTTEGVSGTDVSTTLDPSDGTTTGPKQDLPPTDALVGCTLDAPAGTLVQGPTEFGQFTSQRAYFGWIGTGDPFSPRLVLLSPGADAAAELANVTGSSGPVMDNWVWTDKSLAEGGWPGTWESFAWIYDKGMQVGLADPDVTVTALAGNWDAFDPADPPRLVGTIAGAISGSFNAVYCDKLIAIIIPE
ncbi:hypothetical protein OV090_10030 [Nannocystis sp. RBIL2]|uniref:hypothetical protein n=1 Tax=Nannocystis sp. RBIL2 TaxID=2996788 RepID=UPI002270FF17|nr:hypothetical protein [Nannocystis sp. RBIL2]MCY1065100.1 hypothetical protein [Nannocystis sp. RBIL2]